MRESNILDLQGRDPFAFTGRFAQAEQQIADASRDRPVVDRAGVDTWSFGWYVDPESKAGKAMAALATEQSKRSRLLPDRVAAHRVGWFPQSGLLFAEGHPAGDDELGQADQLQPAVESVRESLADLGVLPFNFPQRRRGTRHLDDGRKVDTFTPGFAGIRRVDTTVDLHFENEMEGLATLCGMAQLSLPRSKKKIVQEVGGRRVETVYFLGYGGRSVLARCYDKGRETATERPGAWIRPEDQRRFSRDARPPLEAVADPGYLRDQFVRRFEPLWRSSKGVIVGGERQLAKRLQQLVDEGAVKPSKAKALMGHIALDAAGVHELIQGRSTVLDDRRECRDLGLVLATDIFDQVEIDLGEQLERAFDSDAWGPQG